MYTQTEKREKLPWYQFHLSTLFVVMGIVAAFFIGLSWWGVEGLWERFSIAMRIGVIVAPFAELHRRFHEQDFPSDGPCV
ncbi:hypothetical protein [Pirellula sp. SH-Sr6A]|uniref:hypothetical protein n=1 Tax=Pirellula sp. SH-Sr6A TaxID=1632865 RepID=UPI0011BAD734|nr:hypothetical protein [Pirellula sp. SH-Sr6A]